MKTVSLEYLGKTITLETGRVAKQADGAVMVHYGDTVVLVTATAAKKESDMDFFPLTCLYQVKTYSQGRILGGFIKRERMPSEMETLLSRMIDRPLRPLFEEGFSAETQVIATVLSYDNDANPAIAAMLGASAALMISDIPYNNPIACANIGMIDGNLVVNPNPTDLKNSDLDLMLVAKEDAIVMVEAGANEVSEADMVKALDFGFENIKPLIDLQKQLVAEVSKQKREVVNKVISEDLVAQVTAVATSKLEAALSIKTKMERYAALSEAKDAIIAEIVTEDSDIDRNEVKEIIGSLKKKIMRSWILDDGKRVDGRTATDVRPITCELGILPKAHGSALFTRGETQALVVSTLGTKDDEQMVDDPSGLHFKDFYLHYNFPAYSVGEVKRIGPPGRREIGHGNLAERGLRVVLPQKSSFPYTIRIVSEITESNGSSSMASVCGGALCMLDAGVPIESTVAGVAMGMISEGDKYSILTDILGDEDHIGDMDFKVVGTSKGITALQMDMKIDGLAMSVVDEALTQAKTGRLHILDVMAEALEGRDTKISPNAPRFIQCQIPPNKIRDLIGPGGKVIKSIQAETGTKLDIDDSGIVNIASNNLESAERALALVQEMTQEVQIGTVYEGRVVKIVDFGAFVEVLPNVQGLVHVSEIANERVNDVNDFLTEGQVISVKAIGKDKRGKLKLSIKALADMLD